MDEIQEIVDVLKIDPDGLRPGQILENLAWEVIDSPTGELEKGLADAASEISRLFPNDGIRRWYAGQLQGLARVVWARRARTAALARSPR